MDFDYFVKRAQLFTEKVEVQVLEEATFNDDKYSQLNHDWNRLVGFQRATGIVPVTGSAANTQARTRIWKYLLSTIFDEKIGEDIRSQMVPNQDVTLGQRMKVNGANYSSWGKIMEYFMDSGAITIDEMRKALQDVSGFLNIISNIESHNPGIKRIEKLGKAAIAKSEGDLGKLDKILLELIKGRQEAEKENKEFTSSYEDGVDETADDGTADDLKQLKDILAVDDTESIKNSPMDPYSRGLSLKRRQLCGMSSAQFNQLSQFLSPMVKKARDLTRKIRGGKYTPTDEFEDNTDDIYASVAGWVQTAIDAILENLNAFQDDMSLAEDDPDYKNFVNAMSLPYNNVKKYMDDFMSLIKSGATPPLEDVYKMIDAAIKGYSNGGYKKVANLFQWLKYELSSSIEAADMADEMNDVPQGEYYGFEPRAIQEVFGNETSEYRSLFDNWYNCKREMVKYFTERKLDKQAKKLRDLESSGEGQQKPQGVSQSPFDKEINRLKSVLAIKEDELQTALSPEEEQSIRVELDRIQKTLLDLQAQSNQWYVDNYKGDEEEEGGMSYMTEQVAKDSKFKKNPNQHMVDRGFRKFKNYNQWMIYND